MYLSNRAKSTRSLQYAFLCLLATTILLAASSATSAVVLAATPRPTAILSFGKTIANDDFTVDYPDGFTATTSGPSMLIASSQAALDEMYKSNPKLTSGNAVIEIYYILGGDPSSAGLHENGIEVLLKGFAQKQSMNLGSIKDFKLGAIEGSRATHHENTNDGTVMTFVFDQAFFDVVLTTASNEASQYEDFLEGVIQSIRPIPIAPLTPPLSPSDKLKLDKSFVSSDQRIGFDYPAGWVVDDQSENASQVNLASSQDAFNAFNKSSTPELTSGQIVTQFYYGSVVGIMMLDSDGMGATLIHKIAQLNSFKVFTIQPFKLGQNHAARIEFSGSNYSGAYIAVTDSQTPMLVGIFTASDELTKVEPILEAMVLSALQKDANSALNKLISAALTTAITLSNGLTLDQTYTSSDHKLSVRYPSGWVAQLFNSSGVIIGNTTKAIAVLNDSTSTGMPYGSVGVDFNYSYVDDLPSNMASSRDPVKLLQSTFVNLPTTTKLGKIETYTIGDYAAARVTADAPGVQTTIYVFFKGPYVVVVAAAAAPGKIAQYQSTVEAMISTIRFITDN